MTCQLRDGNHSSSLKTIQSHMSFRLFVNVERINKAVGISVDTLALSQNEKQLDKTQKPRGHMSRTVHVSNTREHGTM